MMDCMVGNHGPRTLYFRGTGFSLYFKNLKIHTIHHSHFDMKKVPKQDEQVNSLHTCDYKLKWSSRVNIHT